MDKGKLANGIMPILLKHTKEEYVGATGYIKFHEEDFLLFAKELADRIEQDGAKILNLCLDTNLTEHEACLLANKIVKACPIKLRGEKWYT